MTAEKKKTNIDVNKNEGEIRKEEALEQKTNELIMTEDNIEMAHHMEHCDQCQDDPASVLSVLGCNITDEHFEEDGLVQSM